MALEKQELFLTEYVEVVRKNSSDTTVQTFTIDKDFVNIIKWCRSNFGQRGDGWDFSAGTQRVEIKIWSERLITMWKMWKE